MKDLTLHTVQPGNTNFIKSDNSLNGVGGKEAYLSNYAKQCFDWKLEAKDKKQMDRHRRIDTEIIITMCTNRGLYSYTYIS